MTGSSLLSGNTVTRATRWTDSTPTALESLTPNSLFSNGYSINASGQIVGDSHLTGPFGFSAMRAVRWIGTTPTDLGTLGGDQSRALGINDSGQVTGGAQYLGNSIYHAVRWTGTTPTDLGTLGGYQSEGTGINASGQIAGWSLLAGNARTHAVRWTNTTPTDLGTLGGLNSYGYGINTAGDVVGMSDLPGNAGTHPFLFTNGVLYDIFTLLLIGHNVTNLSVSSKGGNINDSGQIAATGTIGGVSHALRLDPVIVPEPTTFTLLALTSLPLLTRRRRAPRP